MTGIASAQPENSSSPFNPFSTVENFVEDAEVQLAGVIGGPDLQGQGSWPTTPRKHYKKPKTIR